MKLIRTREPTSPRLRAWLTAGITFVASVAAVATFAADGISEGAVSKPNPRELWALSLLKRPVTTPAVAARRGFNELAGGSRADWSVAWDEESGLWLNHNAPPHWWQSALALRTLVRYLERTRTTNPKYQRVILATYNRNVMTPHADPKTTKPNFVNNYLDDTAWWGLTWLEAAKYELRVLHDLPHANTFLQVAEADADAVATAPKWCGGIEWKAGYPPDTIANAEYAALAAGLYDVRNQPGAFEDPGQATHWLSEARSTIRWLVKSKLVDMKAGTVADKLNGACNKLVGGPMTYTQGEVAEALTTLGAALHDRSYFKRAARFLRYTMNPANGLIRRGVLQEPCESRSEVCENGHKPFNMPAFKGVFMQAVSDWQTATGNMEFDGFLRTQASAILSNSVTDGAQHAGTCKTPHTCQFGFHWAFPLLGSKSKIGVSVATQTSALDALTAVLPRRGPT